VDEAELRVGSYDHLTLLAAVRPVATISVCEAP